MAKAAKPPRYRELGLVADALPLHEEIDGANHRTTAIAALAYVENNLVLAIKTRLRELDDAGHKVLFEEGSDSSPPLRDFAAKVDMGFALNLYDDNVRKDLNLMRRVRNKFAHDWEVRDFDHSLVSWNCDQLHGADLLDLPKGRTTPRTRRERYVDLAFYFAARFSLETKRMHRPPPSLNRIGAGY